MAMVTPFTSESETPTLRQNLNLSWKTPKNAPIFMQRYYTRGHRVTQPAFNILQLVKAREAQRIQALAEGRMDDPTVPKSLEDAFYVKGTCPDMCPRFERYGILLSRVGSIVLILPLFDRYRRQHENNLMRWEVLPPPKNKFIDHTKAVKMYERGAGDRSLPSDIRPEPVLIVRISDALIHCASVPDLAGLRKRFTISSGNCSRSTVILKSGDS